MTRLIYYILAGIIGIWLATGLPEVNFTGGFESIALAGFVLGIINFAVKPIIDILTIPLKILTLGLFSIFLNMAIVWAVDVLILDKIFVTFWTLFLATAILSVLNIILIKK
jgi:putative membrane protein